MRPVTTRLLTLALLCHAGGRTLAAPVEQDRPRPQVAPEGWFAYAPPPDPFAPAALDLRELNERFAGESGWIQAEGDHFIHGRTGQPVRFWAVNTGPDILAHDSPALHRFARHLAKVGVNMVRLHGPLWSGDDVSKVDLAKLDRIQDLVANLKREGIYLCLSTYFPAWMHPRAQTGLAGFDGAQMPFAVPFFNPRFQELQKDWWRTALTAPNPHTGVPLGEDPALAFLEIINEDGLLFWTFTPYQNVPAPQMEILERAFGAWLKTRYGGIDKAFHAWGEGLLRRLAGAGTKGDEPSQGRVGFIPLYDLLKRRDARARDTATFLAETQRRYFDGMSAYLKNELGFKGAVSGSNWITADARVLGPLDKWSNAGCDFMDRHGYFAAPHQGPHAGYLIANGDRYNDAAAPLFETGNKGETSFELPIMDVAYNGKPSTNSEINWLPPNRFRADMPLLTAAYGALQGSDAFFFFTTLEVDPPTEVKKFSITDPAVMGQFPGAALLFRSGLVKTAEPVVHLEARLGDLEALQGISVAAPENLDTFRRDDVPAGKEAGSAGAQAIDPLAFLVGRVEVNVSAAGGESKISNFSTTIDRRRKTVASATGELHWDYGRGVVTIDATAAQGATGFLARAGTIRLGDITIRTSMQYGAILVVAMDGQPLHRSRKMLLQVMSEDENSGWRAPGDGLRSIADVGGPPILVRKLEGQVSFERKDASSLVVTPLDFNGYELPGERSVGGADKIVLRPERIAYVIRKK